MSVDVVVDEQALREIYLVPFEAAVRRAGVWAVMAAYNRVGGRFCSEHHELLTEILRDEWGFDGVVVSDWFGTRSVAAIEAGLDLEMPGPAQLLGGNLAAAVELGQVTEAAVDRSATRVLGLMGRTTTVLGEPVEADHAAAISREAADEGIVLLHNDGVLPLDRPDITRVAVIGSRADAAHVQGGGSAQVTPPHVISPLRGIATRAADAAVSVIHEPGRVDLGPMLINRDHLAIGDDGEPGSITLDFHAVGDLDGPSLHRDLLAETNLIWLGEPAPGVPTGRFSARATASFVPDRTGRWTISLSSLGSARLLVDGVELLDTTDAELGGGLLGMFTQPRQVTLDLVAATTYEVVAEIEVADEPLALPAEGGGDNLPPLSLAGMTVQVTPPQLSRRRRASGRGGACCRRGRGRRGPRCGRDRGPGPQHHRPAARPGGAHPPSGRREPLDGGRGEHRLAGERRLGRRRRRGHPDVVPRPGGRHRARRSAVRRRRRLRPASDHLSAPHRGHAGASPLPRRGRDRHVRRGRLRGLPPLRHVRRRAPLLLRPRAVVHDVRVPGAGRRSATATPPASPSM